MSRFAARSRRVGHFAVWRRALQRQEKRVAVGVAFVVLIAGCSMTKLPAYQASPGLGQTREASGIQVTVDPFFDKQRSEQFFKLNGLRQGIAIVHARLTNTNADETILVRREDFHLLLGDADVKDVAWGIERSTAAGEAVALSGAALLSLPMIFAGAKLLSDASVVRHNFSANELRSQTLGPSESAEGFLYFQIDKKQASTFAGTLMFDVRSSKSQPVETLQFPLQHED